MSLRSCSLILIPKQTVDVSLKLLMNTNNVIVNERKVDLCENTKILNENISEPLIPRMMLKHKEWISGYSSILENASLRIYFKLISTTSWVELVILSNLRNSNVNFSFRRFAMDFFLNAAGIKVPADISLLNKTSNILMFKSSSKMFDSNVSVTIDINVIGVDIRLLWYKICKCH